MVDSIIDTCIRNCLTRYFQTLEYKCAFEFQLANTRNNEIFNLTISDTRMRLFEFDKRLKNARRRSFMVLYLIKY